MATGATVSLALTGTVPDGIAQRVAAGWVIAWLFLGGLSNGLSQGLLISHIFNPGLVAFFSLML
jgi:hypothetical protein